jgi:uncharacterized membrane protein YbhN (UPF0104 family)
VQQPIGLMANKRVLKILLLFAKVAVIAACFVYIFLTIGRNLESLRETEFTFRLLPLVASFPFAVGYLLGRGLIWHLVVRRMIGRFPVHADLLSWMSSLLGKYLPGKVFLLFGRVYFYRGSGATTGQVSLCFLIEACCSGLATLLVFGSAVTWQRTAALGVLKPVMAAVAAVLLIATHPAVLRAGINAVLRLAKRPELEIRLRWRDVLGWTLLLSVNWLILGAGFYLLLRAIIDVPPTLYLFVTGAFAVAGIVGVLVLFAPSGIGVREGVMTFVLSAVLPAGVAAVAAILARVWMTLAEALCSGVALFVARGRSFREAASDAATEQHE